MGIEKEQSLKRIDPVDFSHVKIADRFWSPRLKSHATTTLAVCIDQIENRTGRIRNFENAAKGEGKHSGIYFDDSDVYKALEGIAYTLNNNPDSELEKKADEWIDKFAAAQQSDGYLNTFYTLTGLDKRWNNMDKHEMYCAGHMTEAAVAYYQATGKRKLLDVAIRMANHMLDEFGPGKRDWVPGHEEIELALVKLYDVTRDKRYLDFANRLLEERGHGHGSRGSEGGKGGWNQVYYQDDVPVRNMTDIAGHAVRAMYLYCGMADVAILKKDTGYIDALNRLWDDVVLRNMYITGGIGSSHHNEGFTEDYDLPNYDAYCETCASVGMVYWNWRMNQFSGDSKYVDVLERSMYNGALAGISLAGDRFFYVNPLASKGNHHRQAWYGTACCPSQISRFLPSVGNYIYATSADAVWVNLYIGNTAEFTAGKTQVKLQQETDYPWNGAVQLTVQASFKKDIRLRIPEWCKAYTLSINGKKQASLLTEKGYVVLHRKWKTGDRIDLNLDMPVEIVAADPRVKEDTGKRAIQRGPLVYCAEQADNADHFDQLSLSSDTKFTATFNPSLLNGVMTVKAASGDRELTFIPYYSWDNREAGEMKVWID
ncbi:MAG: glycoside hydrolase family 127 protein, partial [Mediterranea sp.]|nr:glycoside hydrolase family 127 protein [Mediterranea sp.]